MLTLPPDLKEFIELLNSNSVRYLVVGGYAVAFHGHPRFTGDIDFFVDLSADNASRIEKTLTAFGFGALGLTAQDFLQPDTIVQLGYPPNCIDLITSVSGVTFSEAWEERVSIEVNDVTVSVIGKEALLVNKRASGRPKDIADIDALA